MSLWYCGMCEKRSFDCYCGFSSKQAQDDYYKQLSTIKQARGHREKINRIIKGAKDRTYQDKWDKVLGEMDRPPDHLVEHIQIE